MTHEAFTSTLPTHSILIFSDNLLYIRKLVDAP